jgi:hypothetical protein
MLCHVTDGIQTNFQKLQWHGLTVAIAENCWQDEYLTGELLTPVCQYDHE